jgi:hypothetical protein
LHPIPDDVSPYSTEDIVRNVRCEAKEAVRERIERALLRVGLHGMDPERVLEPGNLEVIKRTDMELAKTFAAYGGSSIAYRFEFTITENNDKNGSVTFKVPFVGGDFSLKLNADKLNKQRKGVRVFHSYEAFADLVHLDCDHWQQPPRNIAYPLTGSIGMGRIMNAFIDVSELKGGENSFIDDITFTTFVRGAVKPVLVLEPVINQFRVVAAQAQLENNRQDIHRVTVAFAFPDFKKVETGRALTARSIARLAVESTERVLINMCIAEGEAREDQFGVLREISPRDYCYRNGPIAPW